LHWILLAAGISRSELAIVAALPRRLVDEVIHGRRADMQVSTLLALARTLSCPADWLAGITHTPPRPGPIRRAFARLRPPSPPRARRRASRRYTEIRSVWAPVKPLAIEAPSAAVAAAVSRGPRPGTTQTRGLGERLAQVLADAGIAQAAFARVAGLHPSLVYDVCHERRTNIFVRQLAAIVRCLGCSTAWLLGLGGDPPRKEAVLEVFAMAGGGRLRSAEASGGGFSDVPMTDAGCRSDAPACEFSRPVSTLEDRDLSSTNRT
jgi:transcriptional regulator with XRE-family HTH domain